MGEQQTVNAVIQSARITNDDHGLLSAWLDLDYGGCGQGFGGYSLYLPAGFKYHNPSGPNYAGHFIWRVMEVAGVSDWNSLPGKTIRAIKEHGKVHAVGHIVKDDWFNPSTDFKKMSDAMQHTKGMDAEGLVIVPKEITPAIACALEMCGPPESQTPEALAQLVEDYRVQWSHVIASATRQKLRDQMRKRHE